MNDNICQEHSGCLSDIEHLKDDSKVQWDFMRALDYRIDGIMNRLNIILGGIVVACILLAINTLLRIF